MTTERPRDDGEQSPEWRFEVPDDVPDAHRDAYLRGLRDMAEYFGQVAHQTMVAYDRQVEPPDPDVCPECGDDLTYNPATGEKMCMNGH